MTTNDPNCPKCGGNMWDNRASKRKPTQPDFKCKDRGCDGVIWPPKGQASPSSNGNGAHASNGAAPSLRRPLGPLYHECLDFAKKCCAHHFGNDVATADVVAAAATLFIQAVKDNAPIRAVVAAPEPPPAPTAAPAAPAGYSQSTDKPLPF